MPTCRGIAATDPANAALVQAYDDARAAERERYRSRRTRGRLPMHLMATLAGGLILLGIVVGFFAFMVHVDGWRTAVVAYLFAAVLTGAVVGGTALLVYGLSGW